MTDKDKAILINIWEAEYQRALSPAPKPQKKINARFLWLIFTISIVVYKFINAYGHYN
jgi:hypothetical protein